jgi:predicted enzyme related to lactoylglutathione lyase
MDGSALLAHGVRAQWSTFFGAGAGDVDKTLQVITEHGGSVLRPGQDTPYGRLAAAADPTGAPFNRSSLS